MRYAVDLLVVALVLIGATSGWRLGALGRAATWVGLGGGVLAASLVASSLTRAIGPGRDALVVAAAGAVVVLGAIAGQVGGAAVLACLRRPHQRARRHDPGRADRAAGAAVGAVGALGLAWLLVPLAARTGAVPDADLEAARLAALVRELPPPPDPFPGLLAEADLFDDISPPPSTVPDAAVADALQAAVVRVEPVGGCSGPGSGVVVEGAVVTAAHVVAQARSAHVVLSDGTRRRADLVAIDEGRDLALLRPRGAVGASLTLATAGEGDPVFTAGFPEGAPQLRIAAARVHAEFDDELYEDRHGRHLVLAGTIRHGQSGGPVVAASGEVLGIIVARHGSVAGVAVAAAEVRSLLAADHPDQAVSAAAALALPCPG